jgi:hypothetical protein
MASKWLSAFGLLLVACAQGQLSARPGFSHAAMIFPDDYDRCDRGDAAACGKLAMELGEWSDDHRSPEVAELHRLACSGGLDASCAELYIMVARHEPSSLQALKIYCAKGLLRACESLATDFEDEASAKAGCEMGSSWSCRALSRIWHPHGAANVAASFFGGLCKQGNAEGCVLAATWAERASPPSEHPEARSLPWYHRACTLGQASGCVGTASALVKRLVRSESPTDCRDFGESARKGCSEGGPCAAHLFCEARRGRADARAALNAGCRKDPGGTDCALLIQVTPAAPPATSAAADQH